MDNSQMNIKEYTQLPLLALRGMVMLPGDTITFDVGRKKSIAAVQEALERDKMIMLVTQKDMKKVDVDWDDLYNVGVYCKISQVLNVPDSKALRISISAISRVVITQRHETEPFFTVDARECPDTDYDKTKFEAVRRQINNGIRELETIAPGQFQIDQLIKIVSADSPSVLADMMASRALNKVENKQAVLETMDPVERLVILLELFNDELEILKIEQRISAITKKRLDKNQRDYILREKISTIRRELGEDEKSETDGYRERMKNKALPEHVSEKLTSAINRLDLMPAASHEAPSLRTYIECVLDLPWTEESADSLDIKTAKRILDRDHYGLKIVKQRIIEHLAVGKYTGNLNGQILCLVGPPGVGKTSIASSIAEAVGRNFVRMSLGGIDDESEIRGHRRTYIGAMPGRIITAMRQAKTINPVILFDEIDKLAKSVQGDPAAAMLEVLDSAQNFAFRDHFLEIPYDLSKVMFITTANNKDTIPAPLLDRMEIIEVPGYLEYEKVQIASKHLLPKQLKKHGLTPGRFSVSEAMLREIISKYTAESGVRELERVLGSLCRKATCELLENEGRSRIVLTAKRLAEYLGAPKYTHEASAHEPIVGVSNGLAWTAVGGELLTVEVQVLPGTGELSLTGRLGDVMKESAQAALTYVRSIANELCIDEDFFKTHSIHIHVPEGAVPKDGPSAGITLMTAMVSAITNIPVDGHIAMTGEITLRGRVLRIGGLREKLLASIRAGIERVIVPEANRSDVMEMEDEITSGVRIHFVTSADEVRALALMPTPSEPHLIAHDMTPAVMRS